MKPESLLSARPQVRALSASKIRELVNEGLGNPDVLAFWVGEPDLPTPQFIRRAGIDSIAAGEVFYTHNLGIAELREALAAYLTRLHRRVAPEETAIASSGVNALMLASQLVPRVAALIEKRLGRKLEPFDIWYSEFRPRSRHSEPELDTIVRQRYPTAEHYRKDIPNLLQKLGFTTAQASYLAENIIVDPDWRRAMVPVFVKRALAGVREG